MYGAMFYTFNRERFSRGTVNTCEKTGYISNKRRRHWLDSEGIWGDNLEPACKHPTTVSAALLFFVLQSRKQRTEGTQTSHTRENREVTTRDHVRIGGAQQSGMVMVSPVRPLQKTNAQQQNGTAAAHSRWRRAVWKWKCVHQAIR